MILILSKSNTSCVGQILAVNRIVLFHQACSAQILKQVYACASCASRRACGTIGQNGEAQSRYVKDFEDVSGTLCCPPPVLLTAQRAKLSHVFNGQNYLQLLRGFHCPWHHSNLFMQAHLCCVVCLLRSRAVLCLSHSWAVSERSDSLCCWCASLLLSLSYCHFSSLTCLLYLWTRSLAWRCHLFSKSSIVS